MVGWHFSEQAEYAVLPHFHPGVFEFHVVARGQVSYLIDGHYHTMSAGDILLIQPDMPHGTVDEPLGRCERYWFQIHELQPGGSLLGQPLESSQQIARQLKLFPTRPFRGGSRLVPLMEQIVAAYRDEDDPLRVVNLRNLILRAVLEFLSMARPNEASTNSSRIQHAIGLIEQSKTPVTITDLARAAGMSESAFKLLFKKETGLPPVDFATRHRIGIARRLLLSTKRSVTDIAHELGFSSSQHFATAFRRYSGQSPNEFRSGAMAVHWNSEPITGEGVSFLPLIYLRQET